MFKRRKRTPLKQAIQASSDAEPRALQAEIARRKEHIAQLELELFDTRAEIARFEHELESRLGLLRRRLDDLHRELDTARRRAERRAQWGERADSDRIPDVLEQFRKTWEHKAPPPSRPSPERSGEIDEAEFKHLYRELAKRFHPDLVTDRAEKRWREEIMSKVNEAYTARDLSALQELATQPDRPPEPVAKSREQLIAELRADIHHLDGVIAGLEHTLSRLANSDIVSLQLETTMARRAGRDLLSEMAADLQVEIAEVEAELARLR